MTPEEIEKLTLIELESLAYRQLVQIEIYQKNLQVINSYIQKANSKLVQNVVQPEIDIEKID